MVLPISIRCPHCGVKLKIQNAAMSGKRLNCPKCGKSFTREVLEEPKDETDGIAEENGLETHLPAPPLKKRGKSKTADSGSNATSSDSKKKSQESAQTKSSNKMPLLLIGGGGLLLTAFAVWMMMGRLPTVRTERATDAVTLKLEQKTERGNNIAEADILTPEQQAKRNSELTAEEADGLNRQGLLHLANGNPTEAEPFFRQALGKFGSEDLWQYNYANHPHPVLAETLNNVGTVLQARGNLERAEHYYIQALEMRQTLFPTGEYPNGNRALAISLRSLGNLFEARGEPAEADGYYRKSLEMRQKQFPVDKYPEGHPDLAESLTLLGGLLGARGELSKAEPYCHQALEMNQRLYPADKYPEGHPDLALSLNNMGIVLQGRGQLADSESYFRRALEMYQKLYPAEKFPQGHPALAQCLNNMGLTFQFRSEWAEANSFFRMALEMRQKLYPTDKYPQGHPDLATTLNNLGVVLKARGELPEAETYFRQALELHQKHYPRDKFPDGHPTLARSLHNLGELLHARGELAQAEPFLLQAVNMYRERLEVLAELSSETEALNFAASLPNTRDLYLTVTAQLPGSQKHKAVVGTVSSNAEDPDVYSQIWQSKGMLMRIVSRHHQDLLATQNSDAKKYKGELDQTRLDLNRALNQPLSDPDKQAERMLELTQKKENLEKAIGAALHEQPPSPEPIVEEAEKKIRELGVAGFKMPKPQKQANRVTARGIVKNTSMVNQLPAKTILVDFLRYDRVAYDQNKPPEKSETRTPHYVAFVVKSAGRGHRVELGPADVIEEDLKSWRNDIEHGRPSEAAQRLSDRLWRPLLKHEWTQEAPKNSPGREPGARHFVSDDLPADTEVVYLSPDAELTKLPWPALPGRQAGKVLLEEHALALIPHGPFLFEQLQQKPRAEQEEGVFLAYGDVDYDRPPGDVDQRAVDLLARNQDRGSDGQVVWKSLAGTARELDQISDRASLRKFKTVERRGSQASVAELINDLPKARWAHFATHGFFADADSRSILQLTPADYERSQRGERIQAVGRSPLLLSGIVLSGANRKSKGSDERFDPDGGIMTGEALIGMRLEDLDLVVLSACETGLGDVAGGEGVFGLQRSFHVAGTHNVVSSLWKVEDDATAALMTLFYQKLWAEEKPPVVALREAQLHLYRHPEKINSLASKRGLSLEAMEPTPREDARRAATRQWAAFTLSGLGRPVTPKELPGRQQGS